MLDKTVPYQSIIMVLPADRLQAAAKPCLPTGYAFRFYQPGDEKHWARIETAVLEFDTEAAALDYYSRVFLPDAAELPKRCVFVVDPDGMPVATATAWEDETPETGRQRILHWVSVLPDRQGLGLGKAVVQRALQVFAEQERKEDVYLHTQTWSHTAVQLYRKLGFLVMKSGGVILPDAKTGERCVSDNGFAEAIAVLRPLLKPAVLQDLIDSAR